MGGWNGFGRDIAVAANDFLIPARDRESKRERLFEAGRRKPSGMKSPCLTRFRPQPIEAAWNAGCGWASWRSGYAEDCKSLHPGSIPGEASILLGDWDMNADFAELRTKMVDGQLRTTDVTDPAILEAMFAVPREAFVDEGRRALAYIDEDIEIAPARPGAATRYLMEPSPFAKLLQLAEIAPTDRVLDVGVGTGYSSAVLSRLAASVIALESEPELAERARALLGDAANVTVVSGALEQGHAAAAPYDVILVEGAVEQLPEALLSQLNEGGRLVAVEGHGNAGVARVHLRTGGSITSRRAFNAAVKPLPGFERTAAFEF